MVLKKGEVEPPTEDYTKLGPFYIPPYPLFNKSLLQFLVDNICGQDYNLLNFWTQEKLKEKLVPFISRKGKVSLRTIEWLVVNYSSRHGSYIKKDGKYIYINNEYTTWQSKFGKDKFDPFCRRGNKLPKIIKTGSVGKNIILDVKLDDTIKDLKEKIFEKKGFNLKNQIIIYKDRKLLNDIKTLNDYKIPFDNCNNCEYCNNMKKLKIPKIIEDNFCTSEKKLNLVFKTLKSGNILIFIDINSTYLDIANKLKFRVLNEETKKYTWYKTNVAQLNFIHFAYLFKVIQLAENNCEEISKEMNNANKERKRSRSRSKSKKREPFTPKKQKFAIVYKKIKNKFSKELE